MDIASLSSGTGATASAAKSRFSELTSEEFVRILFTELSNQDPLKPNDSNALLEQVSSIRSIESDLALQRKLESVVTQNQLSTAGALLGKHVSGRTENFDSVQGVVRSVAQTSSGPVLVLSSGARVPFDLIDQIREQSSTTSAPTTPGSTTPPTTTPPSTTPTRTPGTVADPDAPLEPRTSPGDAR